MIEVICGLLGAGLGVSFFVAGFFLGRRSVSGKETAGVSSSYQPTEEEIAEQEKVRERLRQEQEAFHELVGYSADVAYGLRSMPGKE